MHGCLFNYFLLVWGGRGVDEDKWQPRLKVYQKSKGSKAEALIWHSLDDKVPSWDLI